MAGSRSLSGRAGKRPSITLVKTRPSEDDPVELDPAEAERRRRTEVAIGNAAVEARLRQRAVDEEKQRQADEKKARRSAMRRALRPFKKLADSQPVPSEPVRAKRGPRPIEQRGEPGLRETRKAMTVYFPPEVSKGLRAIALEEDTTMQAIVGEAIDLLMQKRGKPPFGAR